MQIDIQARNFSLPDDLAEKLVDVIPASGRDQQTDLVMATRSALSPGYTKE